MINPLKLHHKRVLPLYRPASSLQSLELSSRLLNVEVMIHLGLRQLEQRPALCNPPFLELYVSILGTARYRMIRIAQNVSIIGGMKATIIVFVLSRRRVR